MSAHRTAAQLENITGGILMAMMIGAENGRARAMDRHRQAQAIVAHNRAVVRIRDGRRRAAAAVAAQVAIGETRMARWLDRVSH